MLVLSPYFGKRTIALMLNVFSILDEVRNSFTKFSISSPINSFAGLLSWPRVFSFGSSLITFPKVGSPLEVYHFVEGFKVNLFG
jgi:hypothetical protein